MGEEQPRQLPQSMDDFLTENERKRAEFEARIGRLSDEQMTEPTDLVGWTVKDHIAHLSAWERSMTYALERKPRHEGLGVPEVVYQIPANYDPINEIIFQKNRKRTLDDVMAEFQTVHAEMLAVLNSMTWADLELSYASSLLGDLDEDSDRPVWFWVYGNSGGHCEQHTPWIEAIVSSSC